MSQLSSALHEGPLSLDYSPAVLLGSFILRRSSNGNYAISVMEESNQIQHYQVTDLGMGQVTMLDVVLDVCSNRSRMFASHRRTGLLLRSHHRRSSVSAVSCPGWHRDGTSLWLPGRASLLLLLRQVSRPSRAPRPVDLNVGFGPYGTHAILPVACLWWLDATQCLACRHQSLVGVEMDFDTYETMIGPGAGVSQEPAYG